jgi:hypothetical protein
MRYLKLKAIRVRMTVINIVTAIVVIAVVIRVLPTPLRLVMC